jgi:hypothetical protein
MRVTRRTLASLFVLIVTIAGTACTSTKEVEKLKAHRSPKMHVSTFAMSAASTPSMTGLSMFGVSAASTIC